MIDYTAVIVASALIAAATGIPSFQSAGRTTPDRIKEYNYPVDTHTVHTPDGYILTLFRIPYSPRLQNQNEHRPVAFLQHGAASSSDGWILNGPDNALTYLLVDAGYDVWLGNFRGNTYSKKHERLSTLQPSFWDFSFHEIAVYDVSASIDYILDTTGESGLHYVAHSMGTTIFFVLMAVRPEYNAKIKTCHLMAPVAFASHMKSPPVLIGSPFVKYRSPVTDLLENKEIVPYNQLVGSIFAEICAESSPFQPVCIGATGVIAGWNSRHLNKSLVADFFETHPAGSSTNSFIHYGQEYESGHFRMYDYGPVRNLRKYKRITPPDYNLRNIVAPVRLYYSDNDFFAVPADVKITESMLPNVVESFRVPYPDWNHVDFLLGYEVKETLYDGMLKAINRFEATGEQ